MHQVGRAQMDNSESLSATKNIKSNSAVHIKDVKGLRGTDPLFRICPKFTSMFSSLHSEARS